MSNPRPPFVADDVLLLGPGPSTVSHRVRQAMTQPLLGHLDPQFTALMDRTQADLRQVFATANPFTIALPATGTGGMEAMLGTLIEPRDRVVVGVSGYFGERMREIAARFGGDVVEVRAEPGRALDADAMIAAMRAGPTRVVTMVHAETSTGVLQDPLPVALAAREIGALVVLDCVTSLGGVPVELDTWGIDAAYACSQKCLGAPPGLSPVSLSPRAERKVAARATRPTSFYFDHTLLSAYWGPQRAYHHTAPVAMFYALAAALDETLAEGLSARCGRHRAVAAALARGLVALGLELLVVPAQRAPMLTTVRVPATVDDATLRQRLRQRHRIEIGGGLGPLRGRVWRIGLMGDGARAAHVERLLLALGDELGVDPSPAVAASRSE